MTQQIPRQTKEVKMMLNLMSMGKLKRRSIALREASAKYMGAVKRR